MNVPKKREMTKGVADSVPEVDYEDTVPEKEIVFKDHREVALSSMKTGDVQVNGNVNYTFNLPKLEGHYFDPGSLMISAQMKLMKEDRVSELDTDVDVAVISSLISTMFNRLDIYSMGQLVRSYPQFGLQSYIWTLLNTSRQNAEKNLKYTNGMSLDEGLFVNEEDDQVLPVAYQENGNTGLYWRIQEFANSSPNDFCAELDVPLFSKGKLLPLNSQFRLEFFCNSNEYCALKSPKSKETPQLVVRDLELKLHVYELYDKARQAIERPLKPKNQGLVIHFQDLEFYSFSVPKGSMQFNTGTYVSLPARLFAIAFVSEAAYFGDIKLSPLTWLNIGLEKLELAVDDRVVSFKQGWVDHLNDKDAFQKTQALLPLEPGESIINYEFFHQTPIYLMDPTPSGVMGNDRELFPEKWVDSNQTWCLKGRLVNETERNAMCVVVREVDRKLVIDSNFVARVE